ncbi:hypothetical protein ACETRX_22750 [Labrys portucalensis]|uniref:Uncharacterized protein n=1 Tax=Labrys neptuniae TaxID=376174 RepID=A0ABV6ZJV9_9HYPH
MPENDGLTAMEAWHLERVRTLQQEACDAHLDDLRRVYGEPIVSVPTKDGGIRLRIPFNPRLSLTGSPGLLCDERAL